MGEQMEINIPLPFTINKFVNFLMVDEQKLEMFWDDSQELAWTTIKLD